MSLRDLFGPRGPRCPRDQARLDVVNRAGNIVQRCGKCHGIWIESKQLRRIADNAELARADQWAGNFPRESGFSCPACAGGCVGTFLEEFSVHTCLQCHGVWMDHAEVEGARRSVSVQQMSSTRGPELRSFLSRL